MIPALANVATINLNDYASDQPVLFQGPKGVFVIFDYVASLLAVVVNIAVLMSVIKARINLTGYKFFLVSLGASNLYLCCVNISIFAIEGVRLHGVDSICLGRVFRSLQMSGFIGNLLNLSGMSLDHLIGIVYPFAYDRIMRKCTMKILLTLLWGVAALLGSVELLLTTFCYLNQSPASNSLNSSASVSDDFSTASSFSTGAQQELPLMKQLFLESNCSSSLSLSDTTTIRGLTSNDEILTTISAIDSPNKEAVKSNVTWEQAMDLIQIGMIDDKTLIEMLQHEFQETEQLSSFQTTMLPFLSPSKRTGQKGSKNRLKSGVKDKQSSCLMKTFLDALSQVANSKSELAGKVMHHRQPGMPGGRGTSWCDFYHNDPFLEYAIMVLTLLCFVFVAICYCKIFREIYFNPETPKRNVRRLVMTTFLLLSTFSICYLPFMIFELSMVLAMQFNLNTADPINASWSNFMVAHNVFNSLLITSPLLQPLLYAGRLSVVRRQLFGDLRDVMLRCCPFRLRSKLLPCLSRLLETTTGRASAVSTGSSPSATFRLASFSTKQSLERYESSARKMCGHHNNHSLIVSIKHENGSDSL